MRRPRWPRGQHLAAVCAATMLIGCSTSQHCGSIALEQYHNSGRYLEEMRDATERATRYLETVPVGERNAAIVLDIDETSLSNWPTIDGNGFCFDGRTWNQWVALAAAPALPPTLEFYQQAVSHGVAVFFITSRSESQRVATERNLRAVGFTNWARLLMKPEAVQYSSAACFKARERCKLVQQGWHIVVNVGDQPSDLSGQCPSPFEEIGVCADNSVLLPNPFYRVP